MKKPHSVKDICPACKRLKNKCKICNGKGYIIFTEIGKLIKLK
jgi:hypothetical protein